MNSRSLSALVASLLATSAMAINPPTETPHEPTGNSHSAAQSNAHAAAKSQAIAGAAALSNSTATGGSADNTNVVTANGGAGGMGGEGGAGGAANQSQSAATGNQSITIQGARQIASLSQGSWAAPECGSGGNAGGSGTGGAGFLGAYWTPADCKLMMIAYTWAHIGMYGEACKTLTATKTLRGAYARYDLPLPDCATLIAALTMPVTELTTVPVAVEPDLSKYATKEEVDRAFKQSMSK